ncbi:MAG: XdhC family protein, partial [Spirochaetia bacterium]
MTDTLSTVLQWLDEDVEAPVYAATVTSIEGSAVRGVGATMAISATGKITGSVSGGCIEPVLIKERERLSKSGKGERRVFCPAEDEVFGAPSPCGGTVEVVLYPISKRVAETIHRLKNGGEGLVWAVVCDGPENTIGVSCGMDEKGDLVISRTPGGEEAPSELVSAAERVLNSREFSGSREEEEWTFFVSREPPMPRLIIVGGSHIGEALCDILRVVGWRSVVVDPREAFSQGWRFSRADTLVHQWPGKAFEELNVGEKDAVAAITHNERMDDEA